MTRGPVLVRMMVAVGAVWALAAAAGLPVRASDGARVTGDEPQYLLTALSLAHDHDLDVSNQIAARAYQPFHEVPLLAQSRPLAGGRLVSPHDPLLPALLALPARAWGWVGAKLLLAAMAGFLGALLVWTAVRRFGVAPSTAVVVVGVFGASAPLSVYGSQVYPEIPAALAVAVGIAAVTGRLRRGGLLAVAGAVVALPWLSVKYAGVAAALTLAGLLRLRSAGRFRAAAVLTACLGLAGAGFLVAHRAWYAGWTPYAVGSHFVGGELTVAGTHPDLLGRSTRLAGLLVDRTFGLAAWQPAWLLAVPAVAALLRRRPAGWGALALPLAAGWLTATFVALTMHGWWWPGRQTVVVLPALVLAIAWWAGMARRRLAAAGALGLLGVAGYAWVLADGWAGRITWVVSFAETTSPLYRAARPLLPDYMHPGPATWALHAVWTAILLWGAAAGWRGHPPSAGAPQVTVKAVRMPSW